MGKVIVPFRMAMEGGGVVGNNQLSLGNTTVYAAIIFSAEATIDVKRAGFVATVAGSTGTVNVTIETVNAADGLPSGTAIVSGTIALGLTLGWNEVIFSTSGTLNAGTLYALRLQIAATPGSAPTVLYAYSNLQDNIVPYSVVSGTRSANRIYEVFYLADSALGGKYYGFPFANPANNAVNNSLPEVGMRFNIPTTLCQTYRLLGLRFCGDPNASAPNVKIAIYNWNSGNNSTALETTEITSFGTANINTGTSNYELYFDTPQTLNAGSDYIAAIGTGDTTSATIPVTVRSWTTPDATKPALFDNTTDYTWNHVSRTTATGSWSTTANSTVEMDLIIDTIPASGGMKVHPGMTGGIRG